MQEDGSVVGEDPGEWVGCQHGEMDDSTCAYMTELGLPVFTRSRRQLVQQSLSLIDGSRIGRGW